MPRVSRSRVIAADQDRVWDLVSDPHNLPRWWPQAARVEDVRGPDGARAHWTTVLETERGSGVRADYRCTGVDRQAALRVGAADRGHAVRAVLRAARLEIGLSAGRGRHRGHADQRGVLRGLSRLGSLMMRGAARDRLDEALAAIERVLVE